MVIEEFLPLLAKQGLRTDRIGFMGWSMGGYGALRLGAVLGRAQCAVVVAESPALWSNGEDASKSGFRDAEEYAEFSVFGRQKRLDGIPVRIDCGTGDPFYRATQDYVDGFGARELLRVGYQPGAHDMGYWRRMAPRQLRYVGKHLA
jgi:dienelactone hydrolase